MLKFFSVLLLALNLINYQYNINTFVFMSLSIIIILIIIILERKEKPLVILIELLIISWPISWVNIFGKSTEQLQFPWYYIFGFGIVFLLLNKITDRRFIKGEKKILLTFVFVFAYSIIPLLICHDIKDGLADFLMINFYLIIIFLCYISSEKIEKRELTKLRDLFIWINFLCSIGIIFQYMMFKMSGHIFFKIGRSGSFSGENQISCSLLFEDTSSSTIMLGCGILYLLLKKEKRVHDFIFLIIMIIGLALTSRRTSAISLVLVYFIYSMIGTKGLKKKALSLFAFFILAIGVLAFLKLSRPVDNIAEYADNNGRFVDYIAGIDIALHNPIGVGYGDEYLASIVYGNYIIPHNTILRWIDIGGLFLAIPLTYIFIYINCIAHKKKMKEEFWVLFYTLFAANLIPDILNARFIVIICIFILLYKEDKKQLKG